MKKKIKSYDEANKIVSKLIKKAWDECLIKGTEKIDDSQRYLIVSRVVGYMAHKTWNPLLVEAVNSAIKPIPMDKK